METLQKKVASYGCPLRLNHPIDRDDNGPMVHHYPWPSSPHQMGRGLSLSRRCEKEKNHKTEEGSLLHTSTLLCRNGLIGCVHKPWGTNLSKRDRTESELNVLRLQGGDALHMFSQTYTQNTHKAVMEGALKKDKTQRSSAWCVWC